MKRAFVAAAVPALSLTLTAPAHAAASPTAPAEQSARIGVGAGLLDVAVEDRTGCTRDSFKHWNAGLNPTDGCHNRNEVLIPEAVQAPTVGVQCGLSGGPGGRTSTTPP